MKRTPLRRRSNKYASLMVKRREFVKDLLEERDHQCEAVLPGTCTGWAVDVHEKLRRSQGGKIVGGDPEDYLVVCRACHDWITINPAKAVEMGLAKRSWDR